MREIQDLIENLNVTLSRDASSGDAGRIIKLLCSETGGIAKSCFAYVLQ